MFLLFIFSNIILKWQNKDDNSVLATKSNIFHQNYTNFILFCEKMQFFCAKIFKTNSESYLCYTTNFSNTNKVVFYNKLYISATKL